MASFRELKLSEEIAEALRRRGIREATPVQERAIPAVRSGRDVIVKARTGTGKTLAFLLPVMEKIKSVPVAQALVMTPTRELAVQIGRVASFLEEATGVRSLVIYGGRDIERQKERLRRHPQLIIGTPGRLLDHIRRRTIDISRLNKVVLDEADEMMKMGFLEDVGELIGCTAPDRQLMLFSATIPDRVRALSGRYMDRPEEITIDPEQPTLEAIRQVVVDTREETKIDQLCRIIDEEQPYLAMVFCISRERASWVAMELARRGYLADELHGDMTQTQRAQVLRRFRRAELQVLVATDIAGRGLDIEGVTHVVNFDLPRDADRYIHRIGRTGRAGGTGTAITFVNAHEYDRLRRIESAIKSRLEKKRSERSRKRAAEKINSQCRRKQKGERHDSDHRLRPGRHSPHPSAGRSRQHHR